MALTLSMSIEDIKKKIKDEVPIQVIADLNGLNIKTFKNALRQYEKETGEKVLPERKRGRPRTDNPKRSTQYRRAKEAREAEEKPEKKTAQVVAKVVAAEPKIEVTKDVIEEIGLRIRDYEYQIENFKKAITYREGEIDAWKRILAVIAVKEESDK